MTKESGKLTRRPYEPTMSLLVGLTIIGAMICVWAL